MYQRVSILAAALLLSSCSAQPIQQRNLTVLTLGPTGLFYEEVVPVAGVSASDLYDRALSWVVRTNGSIQVQDKESKRIVERNAYTVSFMIINVRVFRTVSLEARDGRYKVRFDAFTWMGPSGGEGDLAKADQSTQLEIVQNTESAVAASVASLKASMATGSEGGW